MIENEGMLHAQPEIQSLEVDQKPELKDSIQEKKVGTFSIFFAKYKKILVILLIVSLTLFGATIVFSANIESYYLSVFQTESVDVSDEVEEPSESEKKGSLLSSLLGTKLSEKGIIEPEPSDQPTATSKPTSPPLPTVIVTPTSVPSSVPAATVIPTAQPQYDLDMVEWGFGNSSSGINLPHDMHLISQSGDEYVIEESAFVNQPYHPLQIVVNSQDTSSSKITTGKVVTTLIINGNITDTVELDPNSYGKYDVTFWLPSDVGVYNVVLKIASTIGLAESNYQNNEKSFRYEIVPDRTPPVFDLSVADLDYAGTCVTTVNLSDNSTQNDQLVVLQKVDDGAWTTPEIPAASHCFIGETGDQHTFTVEMTDTRGNMTEKSKDITVY